MYLSSMSETMITKQACLRFGFGFACCLFAFESADSIAQDIIQIKAQVSVEYRALVEPILREVEQNFAEIGEGQIEFVVEDVSSTDINLLYENPNFELLIVSAADSPSVMQNDGAPLAAFSAPFVFAGTKELSQLQETALGEYALGASADQGILGISYLNFGVTWIASRDVVTDFTDLAGRRIGVVDALTATTAASLYAASPISLQPSSLEAAFERGAVDSVAMLAEGMADILPFAESLLRSGLDTRVAVVLTSRERWDNLPYRIQSDLLDVLHEVASRQNARLETAEDEVLDLADRLSISPRFAESAATSEAISAWSVDVQVDRTFLDELRSAVETERQDAQPRPDVRGEAVDRMPPVFFATDRMDTGGAPDGGRFGPRRSANITCGAVKIDSSKSGFRRAILFDITSGSQDCHSFIRDKVEPFDEVLIYIHGYNNDFTDAAARLAKFVDDIGYNGSAILWSWASRGKIQDYMYDSDSANATWRSLRLFIGIFEYIDIRLTLLAHSMGNQPLLEALVDLAEHSDTKFVRNTIFLAPDVAVDIFARTANASKVLSERTTLYACSWDWALLASKRLHAFPRAGIGGRSNITIVDGIESIDAAARVLSKNHSYLFDVDYGVYDARSLIVDDLSALARGLSGKTNNVGRYWELAP